MNRTDPSRDQACAILRILGYAARVLSPSKVPTCDMCAELGDERLWVEVKDSHPPEGTRTRMAGGEAVSLVTGLCRNDQVREDFRDAVAQLKSSAGVDRGLRLIWHRVHAPGDVQRAQALYCTLYGIRWMHISAGPLRDPPCNLVPCVRAGRSLFANHPEICGAIIETPSGIGLRVNAHSPDRVRLLSSTLFRRIDELGGVFDLDIFGEKFKVYDADAGREPREADVVESLRRRYGVTAKPSKLRPVMGCSVATEGNEQGGCSSIPGDRQFVSHHSILLIHQKTSATN